MAKFNCPSTRLFNSLKEKFSHGFEKNNERKSCAMSSFAGRISRSLYSKLEKDDQTRKEVSRGLKKEISIMFADIRGFTRRTETMPPEKIITMLDLFIPEMLHIIMERHKGMVDKLLGDGIMALFGHPYRSGQETLQALYSAVDMQQAAFAMGTVLEIMGYDPLSIGVGINTGEVLICELGNDQYRESTVIGAPVNFAAKMEDVASENEIVLPEPSVSLVTTTSPELEVLFERLDNDKYNMNLYAFNWVKFLESDKRVMQTWEK